MADDSHVRLTFDVDGYWGGQPRDWEAYITKAPRRRHQEGMRIARIESETTGWIIAWAQKRGRHALLSDETMVITSDDGERRLEWRGARRIDVDGRR